MVIYVYAITNKEISCILHVEQSKNMIFEAEAIIRSTGISLGHSPGPGCMGREKYTSAWVPLFCPTGMKNSGTIE